MDSQAGGHVRTASEIEQKSQKQLQVAKSKAPAGDGVHRAARNSLPYVLLQRAPTPQQVYDCLLVPMLGGLGPLAERATVTTLQDGTFFGGMVLLLIGLKAILSCFPHSS